MTTPILSRRMNDAALAALDYVNAYQERNLVNLEAVHVLTSREDLLLGLVLLAAGLRKTAAVANGVDEAELDEVVRAMYLSGERAA